MEPFNQEEWDRIQGYVEDQNNLAVLENLLGPVNDFVFQVRPRQYFRPLTTQFVIEIAQEIWVPDPNFNVWIDFIEPMHAFLTQWIVNNVGLMEPAERHATYNPCMQITAWLMERMRARRWNDLGGGSVIN
jgi:hypothetical protein